MSVTLKESAMQVETVDDVIRWTNKNLVSIGKHMNWLEDTSKESFKACRDDFDKMAKRVKKLERRGRLNWLVTIATVGAAGYLFKKFAEKSDLDDFDDLSVNDQIDGLENRVDFLTKRVNELERAKWTAENKESE